MPPGVEQDHGPSPELVARLETPPVERFAEVTVRYADMKGNAQSPLAADSVEECPIIGPAASADGFGAGPIVGWWPHGFTLRLLRMAAGKTVPAHIRSEEEVLFVQEGTFEVETAGGSIVMAAGDTFTTPKGAWRRFRALSSNGCSVFVLRGGDAPSAPVFPSKS